VHLRSPRGTPRPHFAILVDFQYDTDGRIFLPLLSEKIQRQSRCISRTWPGKTALLFFPLLFAAVIAAVPAEPARGAP
jgi:hypothetical protein